MYDNSFAILLPLSFPFYGIPWAIHPQWDVRERPTVTELRLGEQQIAHRFSKYGVVV
jgi:hypothetical protein